KSFFLSLFVTLIISSIVAFLVGVSRPHADDNIWKNGVLMSVLFGQWVVYGTISALLAPRHGLLCSVVFAILALPLSLVIYIFYMWPPETFGFSRIAFWGSFPKSYM